jgi:hypothetical protein
MQAKNLRVPEVWSMLDENNAGLVSFVSFSKQID